MMKLNRFAWFSWGLLGYNLLVILWGAYVRASGSGAGCGAHWPLCNGVIIPQAVQLATWIEFTHRIMSGLTLLGSIALFAWAWRAYPRRDPVRMGASLVLAFTLTEALLGAGLVLFELVAQNASIARAVSVAAHLVNTLLLVGSLTLTAWLASGGKPFSLHSQGSDGILLTIGLLGVIVLSASGAVTALGDTLFPSASVSQGIREDFLPTANFLIRLRIYHPLIAMTLGIYLTGTAFWVGYRRGGIFRRMAALLIALFATQLLLGLLNISLLTPVWMQLIHLFFADLVWIGLVLFTLNVLSRAVPEKAAAIEKAESKIGI